MASRDCKLSQTSINLFMVPFKPSSRKPRKALLESIAPYRSIPCQHARTGSSSDVPQRSSRGNDRHEVQAVTGLHMRYSVSTAVSGFNGEGYQRISVDYRSGTRRSSSDSCLTMEYPTLHIRDSQYLHSPIIPHIPPLIHQERSDRILEPSVRNHPSVIFSRTC